MLENILNVTENTINFKYLIKKFDITEKLL
jgi:hypothetical protein